MDWEHCFYVTSEIYGAFSILMAAFAYFWLVRDFTQKEWTARLVGGTYLVCMLVLKFMPYYMPNFWAYLIGVLAGLFVMCFMERENFLQKIFLAETFYAIRWLMIRIQNAVAALMLQMEIAVRALTYQDSVYLQENVPNLKWEYFLYLAESILEILIGAGLLLTAVRLIRYSYRDKAGKMQGREFVLMSAPSLAATMGYANDRYMDDLLNSMHFSTYDASPYYHALILLYCMSLYMSIVIVIVLFQNIRERQQEEMRRELLAGQMADMKRHIREVEELYQEIRSLKHDMGNHVMVLQNLAGREREQYAESLRAEYSAVADEMQSGNPVTDVILTERRREAESKGIRFDCSFRYPAGRDVDAFDVSVILNNALTNAIEAAQETGQEDAGGAGCPYIKITSVLRGNVYLIEVENSYWHRVRMDRESGLPITTKEDKVFHGFGLRNIRRVAQKYHGEIEVEAAEAEVFRLSVMLLVCGD